MPPTGLIEEQHYRENFKGGDWMGEASLKFQSPVPPVSEMRNWGKVKFRR